MPAEDRPCGRREKDKTARPSIATRPARAGDDRERGWKDMTGPPAEQGSLSVRRPWGHLVWPEDAHPALYSGIPGRGFIFSRLGFPPEDSGSFRFDARPTHRSGA